MGAPPLSFDEAQRTLEAVHECLEEGYGLIAHGSDPTARSVAAERLGIAAQTLGTRLKSMKRHYNLEIDPSRFKPRAVFSVDPLPSDGEPDAESLILSDSSTVCKIEAREGQGPTPHRADAKWPMQG